MTRLEQLAYAIQKHEGWYPGSRSWRNNNPGNLRGSPMKKGTMDGFAVFGTFATGWLALWWDLGMKCHGKTRTGLGRASTLEELINVWAPPGDNNNTSAYVREVARQLGIPKETKLSWFIQNKQNGKGN